MAFFYDKDSGRLEGIPIIDENKNSVTIVTRHFSHIVISSIAINYLLYLMRDEIDSGFKPEIDDWQFTNYGSYISPGGHCAGQSITAMWYYCEKTLNNEPHLCGLYDNNGNEKTPDLWKDDTLGYRFASTIQEDINWSGKMIYFSGNFPKLMTALPG